MGRISRAAVFSDNKFNDEIEELDIYKVKVMPLSKVIGAPIETGQTSLDHKVREPIKVIVTASIEIDSSGNYSNSLAKIAKMYNNRKFEFYSVCSGADCYQNLILQNCPHDRDVSKFDLVSFELEFVEAILISKQSSTSKNSENSSTRKCGFNSGRGV